MNTDSQPSYLYIAGFKEERNGKEPPFYLYEIVVCLSSGKEHSVWRRFSEFVHLRDALLSREECPRVRSIGYALKLPSRTTNTSWTKHLRRQWNTDEDLAAHRSEALQTGFLQVLLDAGDCEELWVCSSVVAFFDLPLQAVALPNALTWPQDQWLVKINHARSLLESIEKYRDGGSADRIHAMHLQRLVEGVERCLEEMRRALKHDPQRTHAEQYEHIRLRLKAFTTNNTNCLKSSAVASPKPFSQAGLNHERLSPGVILEDAELLERQKTSLKTQDDHLEAISLALRRQQLIGKAIQESVEAEAPKLDHLRSQVFQTQGKMEKATEKAKKL